MDIGNNLKEFTVLMVSDHKKTTQQLEKTKNDLSSYFEEYSLSFYPNISSLHNAWNLVQQDDSIIVIVVAYTERNGTCTHTFLKRIKSYDSHIITLAVTDTPDRKLYLESCLHNERQLIDGVLFTGEIGQMYLRGYLEKNYY